MTESKPLTAWEKLREADHDHVLDFESESSAETSDLVDSSLASDATIWSSDLDEDTRDAIRERLDDRLEDAQDSLEPEHAPAPPILPVFKKMWPYLLLFSLVLIGASYVISPYSHIGSLSIEGAKHEDKTKLANASGINISDKVWQIMRQSKPASQKIVSAFPRIETAKVTIKFPNQLVIKVTEYDEVAYAKFDDKLHPILSNGHLLADETTAQAKANTPILENIKDTKQVEQFIKAYETLKPDLQKNIQTVSLAPTKATPDFVILDMRDGHQVRVPLSQMASKLPYYDSVAKQLDQVSVIDMESGIYATEKQAYITSSESKQADPTTSDQVPAGEQPTIDESTTSQ